MHYVGFKNSQWEGGVYAPVAPLPHYSPLRSHGIFLASHIREFWSRKYPLRACLHQKDCTLVYPISFQCFLSFSSAKSAFSVWQSNQALVEAFQNVDHVVLNLKTLNRVHYLTNFRSTLLVMSRISCYEVAYARLSESRAAEKIK